MIWVLHTLKPKATNCSRQAQAGPANTEQIENPADLKGMGGLDPLVSLLERGPHQLQALAASVLGTAAANNEKFQEQLLQSFPNIFTLLVEVRTLPIRRR